MSTPRCLRCEGGIPHRYSHGTSSGYSYHHCRCDECRNWKREWRRLHPATPEANRRSRLRQLERNPQYFRQYSLKRYWENRERLLKYGRDYYAQRGRSKALDRQQQRRNSRREEINALARRNYHASKAYRQRQHQAWVARNRSKVNASNRARYQLLNDHTPAINNGKPWQPQELAVLGRQDLSMAEICFLLGRSYSAVKTRRAVLNRRLNSAAIQTNTTPKGKSCPAGSS